jgi:phage terminase large subunit-like protein
VSEQLNIELLPWQQEVWQSKSRFKVIAAGRRTGKSRLAAYMLLVAALSSDKGKVFYVAPTQGQARDVIWDMLLELGQPVISNFHVNNLAIKLINGSTITLKGADRPETMRGVSLRFVVLDEYADFKPEVWELILRPALADLKGSAVFIGTPMGRNHFYDLYSEASLGHLEDTEAWHFTSYDNPTLDAKEIDSAKRNMSSYAFRQEFMASFEARGSEMFKEDWVVFDEEEPKEGDYYIAIDPAGFEEVGKSKSKSSRLDNTAIAIVKVNNDGWWVKDIISGRWTVEETAWKIFKAVESVHPIGVGIERGIAKQAIMSPLQDLMRRHSRYFQIQELTHGNQKKTDRVMWALQGRFENKRVKLNKGEWNVQFLDQLFQFPDKLTHDDDIDALAYIDQLAIQTYHTELEWDDHEPLDSLSGF